MLVVCLIIDSDLYIFKYARLSVVYSMCLYCIAYIYERAFWFTELFEIACSAAFNETIEASHN